MPSNNVLYTAFNTLAPVFMLVLLGAALRRSKFFDEAFATALNSFVFWIALPCMLFTSIHVSEYDNLALRNSYIFASIATMLSTMTIAVIAWYLAPHAGISKTSRGSFTQAVFRGNNAYVGIPIILMAYRGHPKLGDARIIATLSLVPSMVLYNVLAVFVLTPVAESTHRRKMPWRRIVVGIAKNPIIAGSVLGVAAMLARYRPPESIGRSVAWLGDMAGPGALVALGASLTTDRVRAVLRSAHIAAALKLVLCPLIGWGYATLLNLSPEARFISLVFLASPTAVASFVMAQSMKGDATLAGGTVALTTVYSFASLGAVFLLAGPR